MIETVMKEIDKRFIMICGADEVDMRIMSISLVGYIKCCLDLGLITKDEFAYLQECIRVIRKNIDDGGIER